MVTGLCKAGASLPAAKASQIYGCQYTIRCYSLFCTQNPRCYSLFHTLNRRSYSLCTNINIESTTYDRQIQALGGLIAAIALCYPVAPSFPLKCWFGYSDSHTIRCYSLFATKRWRCYSLRYGIRSNSRTPHIHISDIRKSLLVPGV